MFKPSSSYFINAQITVSGEIMESNSLNIIDINRGSDGSFVGKD